MNPLTITSLIAPCMPFLLKKVGGSAIESAASKVGEDSWAKAKAIWLKLQPKVESNAAAKVATDKLAEKPSSNAWKAAFAEELDSILKNDADLAQAITEILEETSEGRGNMNKIQQTVDENQGQIIGQMSNSEAKNINNLNNVQGDVNL